MSQQSQDTNNIPINEIQANVPRLTFKDWRKRFDDFLIVRTTAWEGLQQWIALITMGGDSDDKIKTALLRALYRGTCPPGRLNRI